MNVKTDNNVKNKKGLFLRYKKIQKVIFIFLYFFIPEGIKVTVYRFSFSLPVL
jgi:hypothetical protein